MTHRSNPGRLRTWRRQLAAGAALLPGTGAAAEAVARRRDRQLSERGRLIDAGGYRVRVYETGTSGPCVVIVPGAGDCAASWIPVASQVASFACVISYDRAGLGGSDDGPPAALDRYLTELHSVIAQAGTDGPLILAGHSLGGLIARVYTQEHPRQVAGLVQVDATPEAIVGDPGVKLGFLASGMMASMFKALAPFGFVRLLLALGKMPLYPEQSLFRAQVTDEDYRHWTAAVCRDFAGAAGAEMRSVLPAAAKAQRRRVGAVVPEFDDLPLGVLTSRAWGQKWVDMHRELATRSRSSFHRITGDRSHNIHMRHAALVVDSIRDVACAGKA